MVRAHDYMDAWDLPEIVTVEQVVTVRYLDKKLRSSLGGPDVSPQIL